jgi:small GTP-binding protein
VEDPNAGVPKISILGRPNVGKSSLLNALLGTDRSIVTDEAGTTRDAIHSRYKMYGKDFILTDTAGIRKKSKVKDDVEFYSVLRSLRHWKKVTSASSLLMPSGNWNHKMLISSAWLNGRARVWSSWSISGI